MADCERDVEPTETLYSSVPTSCSVVGWSDDHDLMNSCLSVYRLGEGGEYVGWQGRPESSVTVRYTRLLTPLAPRFACFPTNTSLALPRTNKHSYLLNNLKKTKLRTLCLDRVLVWRMSRNDLGFYLKLLMYSQRTYKIIKQLSTSLYSSKMLCQDVIHYTFRSGRLIFR